MRSFKALSITALALGLTMQAQAACFNFVNGKGPSQVGNVALYGPASQICVKQVNGFAGEQTFVELNDAEGALAQFDANVTAVGRCLGYCREMELGYGNANGQNVNAQGTRLTFQVEPDTRLGIQKGTLKITNSYGQTDLYVVVGQK